MAHQNQFLLHVFQVLAYIHAFRITSAPFGEQFVFAFSAAEEEKSGFRMGAFQLMDYLFHEFQGVYLTLVGGKRRDAYPAFFTVLHTDDGGQHVEIASFLRKE